MATTRTADDWRAEFVGEVRSLLWSDHLPLETRPADRRDTIGAARWVPRSAFLRRWTTARQAHWFACCYLVRGQSRLTYYPAGLRRLVRFARRRARLVSDEFARVWRTPGQTVIGVARHFGTDADTVMRRAAVLRRGGDDLPDLPGS